MKKVFLSLAVIAVLTAVSCKKAEAVAEETTNDTISQEAPIVEKDTLPAEADAAPAETPAPAKKQ